MKVTLRHIIFKLLKTKDKEKSLKNIQRKKAFHEENNDKNGN